MTALMVCALIAVLVLAWLVGGLASDVRPARWPAKEPEHAEDDESHDHRLAQLARQLGSPNLAQAHSTVVALADRMVAGGHILDDQVTAFLDHPPLDKPDRYRHELNLVLNRMEQT
jgi:hypothetical protein